MKGEAPAWRTNMTQPTSRGGFLAGLWAIVRERCPRCRRGKVFKGLLEMNDPCPQCGLIFQREEGYFLGAMYVSYGLGCAIVGIAYVIAAELFPDVSSIVLCLCLFAAYVPLMPWVYRYSRVIWLHFDRLVSPGDSCAGSYEKMRRHEQQPEEVIHAEKTVTRS
jgi:uncharacterized protein (DUF983 family)